MEISLKPGEIARLLDAKNLRKPYRELAKILHCHHSLVGHYINGGVKPSYEMLIKWARYLDVEVDDLIVIEDDDENSDKVEDKQRPPTLSRGCEANLHQLSFPL
jgi:transcriptional regulator with XRE-family HTH domain